MAEFRMTTVWNRGDAVFTDNRYSRGHLWKFDGGAVVPASSSPANVKLPFSIAENVDPEEAFVAAIASCHMLWFLNIAATQGYRVDSYVDEAVGSMAKNSAGRGYFDKVILNPHVVFSGSKEPDDAAFHGLHEKAHQECFIANSVISRVEVQGRWEYAPQAIASSS